MSSSRRLLISPSLLASDFSRIGEEVKRAYDSGADWLHMDVMDGNFVPNISFGPDVIAAAHRTQPDFFLDVHLMIERPGFFAERFIKAGANLICFHVEACDEPHVDLIERLHKKGVKVGLAIKPKTSLDAVAPYLSLVDMVLVMTVEPGFGGQSFMSEMMPKVEQLCKMREQHCLDFDIQVDGGIDAETAKVAIKAGANILVAGSSTFGKSDMKAAVKALRE